MPTIRNLDLVLLRTFAAVARTGSISAAARELHLTQGGVSQQIKRLEGVFGYPLLARDAQGARLTEKGMALLPHAGRLLALNDSICAELLEPSRRETVRVGVPYDMAGAHFAPVLEAHAQRYHHVEVKILSGSSLDLLQAFDQGQLDLTIVQSPKHQRQGERLYSEPLVWLGSGAELAAERPLPLCFVTPTCTFRRTVFALLSHAQIGWRELFENASVETTLATVRSGLALTPWLRSLVPSDIPILGTPFGLPALPDFEIHLQVSPTAREASLAMAELIRQHYRAQRGVS